MTIFISMLFCASFLFAQTKYYNTTKTFKENGYTYQCDVDQGSKMVKLYNKDNKWIHSEQVYKDTGTIFIMSQSGLKLVQDDSWTYEKCHSIVENAFSTVEKQRLRGCGLSMSMYIDPNTGKIGDVLFEFLSINPTATIPVSVYRKIEADLKKLIWFTPTSEGKKLNYIFRWWRQKF